MNRVNTPTCAAPAVLLVTLLTAVAAGAQVGFAPSGRPVGDLAGRGVAVSDFNGDGSLDAFVVAHVTWQSCESRVYLGDGRGQFTDAGQRLAASQPSDQPLVLDIDGNGTADVMVGRATWVNDGRGRFTAGPAVLVDADGAPLRGGKLADLNGDGAVDLLWTVLSGQPRASAVRLYVNDGKGKFREAGETPLPGITSAIAIGDLNADRIPDVVVSGWRNEATDRCPNRVLLNDGKGHLAATGQELDEKMNHSHSLALGDLDGDGDLDVVLVAQGGPPSGGVYLNDCKGRFTAGARVGASSIEKVALADFDGDGDRDIFLACIGPNEVWVNDGRAGFTDAGVRLGKDWSWELAIGDFNGDRLPDVFVANFGRDRAAPANGLVARPVEVWLNTRAADRRAAPEAPGPAQHHGTPSRDAIDEMRDRDLQPERIMDAIGLRPGMTVGEAGAGYGYFTFKLSRRVGAAGVVYANDIGPLREVETRSAAEMIANIRTVAGEPVDPRFPRSDLDMIVVFDCLFEFAQPAAWMKNARRYLKPGGRLVIVDPDRTRLASDHFLSRQQIHGFGREAGYTVVGVDDSFLKTHAIVVLQAPGG